MCISPQYNKDLAKVLEGVQVDLQDITLLEQAGRDNLINFANSGIGQIDYNAYLAEVKRKKKKKPWTRMNHLNFK